MVPRALLSALLLLPALAWGDERPEADPDAIRDVLGGPGEGADSYSSSRAYLHYLEAKLAELGGDLRESLRQLQQSVLYDEKAPEIHLGLARLHLKVGERGMARAVLQRFLLREPGSAEGHMMMGLALSMEERVAEAAASFSRAIEADPDFEDAYLVLLKLKVDLGELQEAERLAARLSERRPHQGKAWRILAALVSQRGDASLQTRFLRKAVAQEPGHLSSTLELAGREELSGRLEDAQRLYGMVLERDPTDPVALLGSARIALRGGDETLARAYLRQLFGTHPDPVAVRIQTAIDLDMAKRSESALEVLDEATTLSSDPRIPFFRGLVLEGQRNFRGAIAAYREVPATAGPLYPLSRARWASCLSLLGSGGEGIRILELARRTAEKLLDEDVVVEVLRFVPDLYRRAGKSADGVALLRKEAGKIESQAISLTLARALMDTGQSGEAIRLLEAVVEADPGETSLFALAMAKERAGDPEGAVSVASRILEASPDNPSALNFMGFVLADHGLRLEEAKALLLRAVEIRPDDPAFLDSLGWCELKRGDLAAAEPYLVRAAELEPHDPEILHHLAELYFRTARIEKAVAAWQRALETLGVDPDFRLRRIIEGRLVQTKAGRNER